MGWIRQRTPARLALVAVALSGGLALPARGDDDALGRQLAELNQVTGSGPVAGRLRQVLQSPDKGKALVSFAWGRLKDKKQPFSYNAAYILAAAAQDNGNIEASAAFYRACARQGIELESASKIGQAYGGLIDVLWENKKFDETARVCREILEMKAPEERPRIVLLATTSPTTGDADFAELDHYNSAAFVRHEVHKILIQAITEQGKFDQALQLADNLLKAQDSWDLLELKGWVLRKAGKDAAAAKAYEGVLERIRTDKELDPKRKDTVEDVSRRILSSIYTDLDKIDRATEQLQILVKKHPDDAGYQNDLGYIWADHDIKLDEAEKLIRRALELDQHRRKKNPKVDTGENGAYLDSLGWVLFKKKRLKEAKEVLLKAIEDKESQHIEIFDHLGDVHMALGERAEAVAAWQRGLKTPMTSPRDQKLRERVEKKIQQAK
jgi:tetratricopeptide (TPR) repeat protein